MDCQLRAELLDGGLAPWDGAEGGIQSLPPIVEIRVPFEGVFRKAA